MNKILMQHAFAYDREFTESNIQELKDLIFNTPEHNWMNGSGTTVFTKDNSYYPHIVLGGSYNQGLTIVFLKSSPNEVWYLTEGDSNEIGYSASGGNKFPFFQKYVVSKDLAWKVIQHFIETGEMLIQLNWSKDYDVPDEDF